MASAKADHVVDLPELWTEKFVDDGIQSAREQFHAVYHTDGGMQLDEDPGDVSRSAQPKFEPDMVLRGKIRNSLRSAPSTYECNGNSQHEQPGTASVSSKRGQVHERGHDGRGASGAVMKARMQHYLADTGAS